MTLRIKDSHGYHMFNYRREGFKIIKAFLLMKIIGHKMSFASFQRPIYSSFFLESIWGLRGYTRKIMELGSISDLATKFEI